MVDAGHARSVRRLSHALLPRSTAESCPSAIGLITLDRKQAGERSAGNPHATFDEAGNGNQLTVRLMRHSQRKRRETARHTYGEWRHSSTLLLGRDEETSASFEARSAPRSYPANRIFAGPNLETLSPACSLLCSRNTRNRSRPSTASRLELIECSETSSRCESR